MSKGRFVNQKLGKRVHRGIEQRVRGAQSRDKTTLLAQVASKKRRHASESLPARPERNNLVGPR